MMCRSVLGLAFISSALAATAVAASAAELPPIKTAGQNKVPECATPGRVMAFLKARNSSLDPKFEKIAVHYMREGEALATLPADRGVFADMPFEMFCKDMIQIYPRLSEVWRGGGLGGDFAAETASEHAATTDTPLIAAKSAQP